MTVLGTNMFQDIPLDERAPEDQQALQLMRVSRAHARRERSVIIASTGAKLA